MTAHLQTGNVYLPAGKMLMCQLVLPKPETRLTRTGNKAYQNRKQGLPELKTRLTRT